MPTTNDEKLQSSSRLSVSYILSTHTDSNLHTADISTAHYRATCQGKKKFSSGFVLSRVREK